MTDPEPEPEEWCVACGERQRNPVHGRYAGENEPLYRTMGTRHVFQPSISAPETIADMPNSEAPTAGIGAEPATPASAVQSSVAETIECEACAQTRRLHAEVEKRHAAGDRKSYVYLSDRELHHALIARLRAENEKLRAFVEDPGWDYLLDRVAGDLNSQLRPLALQLREARRALSKEGK